MKHDKVFVRYKNLSESQPYTRERQSKKGLHPDKKKYAEKSNKVRDVIRQVIEAYEPLEEIPINISKLLEKHPKFFTKKPKAPEKDANESLNEFIIIFGKKFTEGFNPKKQAEPPHSESDPDWNSDDDVDGNMESKLIDAHIVQKVVEKLASQPVKKQQTLKRHEKEFLEDYFRTKRLQQQQDTQAVIIVGQQKKPVLQQAPLNQTKINKQIVKVPIQAHKECELAQQKPKNIWSEYQEKQVSSFVDMGFMTKVQDNQEEIQAELAEDDGMFDDSEDSDEKEVDAQRSPSDSQGDQDIFGDEGPSTTVSTPSASAKVEVAPSSQGTVMINTDVFFKIAEKVGLSPSRCNWIISNQEYKYKVSTEYMDLYYRQAKMNEVLPFISLNHSEFVKDNEVESRNALETFRRFDSRKTKKDKYSKPQYKQKSETHKKRK